MRSRPLYRDRLIGVLLVFSWLFSATGTWAQNNRRPPLRLPPALAGTPLSFKIHSEAAYMAGRGSLVESVAIARLIHAEAFAKELENSIEYVDTYFRRRELNREWRAKEDPRYLEAEKIRQEALKRRLKEHFSDVLQGTDPTPELNWLLVELSGPTQSLGYLTSQATLTESESGNKLSEADLALIRFGDGRVTFSATDPQILETRWPFALRAESFIPLQKNFLSARETVLEEIRSEGQASRESGSRLIGSVDDLLVALEKAYPHEERIKPTVFLEYDSAKRNLRSLTWEVHRTIHYGDRSLFDETLRFEGGTVEELIWHMVRKGLVFGPPPPGGDRVYRGLLGSLRNLYLTQGG